MQVIDDGIAQVGHHHIGFLLRQELPDGNDQRTQRRRADLGTVGQIAVGKFGDGLQSRAG